jgi:hypothetical protein
MRIVGVGFQDPAQMHLVQDNDVVHTFSRIDPISRSTKWRSDKVRAADFCHLRGADRVFAIDRIRNIRFGRTLPEQSFSIAPG